jgi:hypothetical protein
MKRYDASLAVAAVLPLSGWILLAPATAAPPTVTPTPGYDARLQEHAPSPVHHRRVRRVHDDAH